MSIGKLKLKSLPNSNHHQSFTQKNRKQEKQQMEKIFDQKLKTKDKITTFQSFFGLGQIVTSGSTLVGNEQTKFKSQVENGDTIIIENKQLKTSQERQVLVVLGDKSILLKEPFIEQVHSFSAYKILKKPKVEKGQDIAAQYQKKLGQIKKTKQITKDTLQLRIKKGMWAYEKETVQVDKNATKQQLLDIRAKKIKDKFCW